jgi:hypothetical protein
LAGGTRSDGDGLLAASFLVIYFVPGWVLWVADVSLKAVLDRHQIKHDELRQDVLEVLQA